MLSQRFLWRYLVYLVTLSIFVAPITSACRSPVIGGGQLPGAEPTAVPSAIEAIPASTPADEAPQPATPETVVAGATAEPSGLVPTGVPTLAQDGRYSQLRDRIEGQLAGLNGQWGIGVLDLGAGDEALLIGADRPYPAASLYKLLLLYTAYKQIAAGQLELDNMTTMLESDYVESVMWDEELRIGDRVSVKGILRVMVIQSSNAAAHALARVMSLPSIPRGVNSAAAELGLSQTHMPVPGDRFSDWRAEQTSTSVDDLARFFTLLYRGQLISAQASQDMLALLKDQQINDRIPARLPKGVRVAHKTGNLTGVVADAGIIFGPRSDVVLVALNDGADYEQATSAIGAIAEAVYTWHNQ